MLKRSYAGSQYFLSQILEELQDEVFVYATGSLEMVYANKAARDRCEWSLDRISENRIVDSSKFFSERAFLAHVKPLLSGKKDVLRIQVTHEKGPVEITTRLSNTPDGDRVFLSVLRDLSERQRAEQAKMDSFSEISHELRTPLTSIKGSLRLLEAGAIGSLSNEATKVLNIASRNTDRLLSIVNDILDLQKMAAGKVDCKKAPLDLVGFVSDAVAANKGYGDEHDVRLELCTLPDVAMVDANGKRIMQVMANLLSNAIKFSPTNESVTVAISDNALNWRVSVRDRGPGIPESARHKLFESFSQLKPEDGIRRKGTGLGLAIAKKIVNMHHGTIGFSSVNGNGTEFFFDLPKKLEAAA